MEKKQFNDELEVEVKLFNSYEAFCCFTHAVKQLVDCEFIEFMSITANKEANIILKLILYNVREFPVENPEVNGRYFEFYLPDGRFYNSLKIRNIGEEAKFKLRYSWDYAAKYINDL